MDDKAMYEALLLTAGQLVGWSYALLDPQKRTADVARQMRDRGYELHQRLAEAEEVRERANGQGRSQA